MLSTNSPVTIGPEDWFDFISIDKVGHFVFYTIFCCLLSFGFFKSNFSKPNLLISIAIVFVYGVLMEFLQLHFYEGRQLEINDMIANLIGALLGALVFSKYLLPKF